MRFPASALFALALTLGHAHAAVPEDWQTDTPATWQWRYGQTTSEISSMISQGYRAVDLSVESASPLRLSAAFVRNTGDHNNATWWYYGQTVSELSSKVSSLNARINDLEIYVVNGTRYCAALLSRNTGSDYRPWAWRTLMTSASEVVKYGTDNNLRPIDVEYYSYNGQNYYAAVYVSNTGSHNRPWWFYANVTSTGVANEISNKQARLVDIERRSNGRHDIILSRAPGYWWWGTGYTESAMKELYRQKGARLFDVQTWVSNSKRYFAFVCNDNLGPRSRRIAQILDSGTDGRYGLYLKHVGGSTLASLRSDFQFEPASALKTLHHVHTMRLVRLNQVKLTDPITVFQGTNGSCPNGTSPTPMTIEQALRAMMRSSSNQATKAIADRFGFAALNSRATHLGMNDTLVQHDIGCGSAALNNPNRLTLEDMGKLHEMVSGGYLGNQTDKFRELMLDSVNNYASPRGGKRLSTVIAEEASKLGLTTDQRNAFVANCQMAYKGGNYGLGGKAYRVMSGWVRLPVRSGQSIVFREYVTGAFNDGASNGTNANNAVGNACTELLRESLNSALATWKGYTPGTFLSIGLGCKASTGKALAQSFGNVAEIGDKPYYRLTNAVPYSAAIFWVGFSRTRFGALPLPFGLSGLGANGCTLYVSPDIALVGPTSNLGSAVWQLPLPSDKNLIGKRYYTQYWAVDSRANDFGFAFSNGIETRIGGKR